MDGLPTEFRTEPIFIPARHKNKTQGQLALGNIA